MFNSNLRKLPSQYGEVSVMSDIVVRGTSFLATFCVVLSAVKNGLPISGKV